MPLTTDEKLLALSREAIAVFDKANGGVHPGFRPAHARGILLRGTFTPSPEAASLTRAPHLHRSSTPVTVRFSDFAGIPTVADNDPQGAGPRGFCGAISPCRACSHRHRRSFGRLIPGAHRRGTPRVPQCVDCDRPCRPAPERHRAVPRCASRGCGLCASSQADSDQLCERVVFRGLCIQVHQRGRNDPLPALPCIAARRQRISRRGRSRRARSQLPPSMRSKSELQSNP